MPGALRAGAPARSSARAAAHYDAAGIEIQKDQAAANAPNYRNAQSEV